MTNMVNERRYNFSSFSSQFKMLNLLFRYSTMLSQLLKYNDLAVVPNSITEVWYVIQDNT